VEPEQVLRELTTDGERQLHARLARWGTREPSQSLMHIPVSVRPTAWAHRAVG
jgi:hypothetical protein